MDQSLQNNEEGGPTTQRITKAAAQLQRTGVGSDGVQEIAREDEMDEDHPHSAGECETDEDGQSAEARRWKNGLCRCNRSSFFWSLFCFIYVLDDVQTRAHLTICGNRSTSQPIYGFGVVGVMVLATIFMVINIVLVNVVNYYETIYEQKMWENDWSCDHYDSEGNWVENNCVQNGVEEAKKLAELWGMLVLLVDVVALAITLFVTLTIISRTRRTIRKNTNVPGGFCKDSILSIFCTPCVLAQMDSHVSEQIETTRSDSWKQQELELQNKRKEENPNIEPDDTSEKEYFGLRVCKWMVFLFVVTLISLVVFGFIGEDQLYFTYAMEIFGVLLAILTLVLSFTWVVRRCLKTISRSQHEQEQEQEQELELGNVSESCQGNVENGYENEIV